MLLQGPNVFTLFSCMYCKAGKFYFSPKGTFIVCHLVSYPKVSLMHP